ncbi:MAG: XRE family transcriptional regulator [Proteobacteria bacterium]|nr:XRE family transcriptional regulator [Pseudomonadota bacterium]MBU1057513.1 XRE family transcriptional regulator [Pseudomonadota bacterium]
MDVIKLGAQLKKHRLANKLTLEALSNSAGCSKSYLSQIENGLASPSLSVLGTLARELGISVATFLNENTEKNRTSWHLPAGKRQTLQYPDGMVSSQPLTTAIFKKQMQPLLTRVQPGGRSDADGSLQHAANSEEFVFVLKGTMEFTIADEKFILKEGDTLYFEGDLRHSWKNPTDEEAEILFVFTPPVW